LRHERIADLIPEIALLARNSLAKPKPKPQPHPAKTCPLAIVCVGKPPASEWTAHHAESAASITHADNATAAAAKLRQENDKGSYFGLALNRDEYLIGNARAALALHPAENLLRIAVKHDGKTVGERSIVRLSDFGSCDELLQPRLRAGRRSKIIKLDELEIGSTRPPEKLPRPAVVFVCYGPVPDERLADHFRWNDAIYRENEARVFVVSDRARPVPDYARVLVYSEPMKVFNLSKTSNYGIRHALESGFGLIIKTDVDMAIPRNTWRRMLTISVRESAVPVYRMAANYQDRETKYVEAHNATGTVSMLAGNWRKAHFHEACEGYGSDDAILLQAIRKAGLRIDRCSRLPIYHIAHIADTPQKEFNQKNPRIDHWGRGDGFNPENFKHNHQFLSKADNAGPRWGLAGFGKIAVVSTHYRLPESRLRDWLKWNDDVFRKFRARVILVTDREWNGLPGYVRCAVYPRELELFNLAKTSNYGIRLAGDGIICKTDPDCVFSADAMKAVSEVTPARGVAMQYRKASTYATRHAAAVDELCKGTLALHSEHWQSLRGYDERMEGYGIEDSDAFHRAGQLQGRQAVMVDAPFWHIAHEGAEHWNRSDGFNPRRRDENARIQASDAPWSGAEWGMGK
jgi:hypothetical protein